MEDGDSDHDMVKRCDRIESLGHQISGCLLVSRIHEKYYK